MPQSTIFFWEAQHQHWITVAMLDSFWVVHCFTSSLVSWNTTAANQDYPLAAICVIMSTESRWKQNWMLIPKLSLFKNHISKYTFSKFSAFSHVMFTDHRKTKAKNRKNIQDRKITVKISKKEMRKSHLEVLEDKASEKIWVHFLHMKCMKNLQKMFQQRVNMNIAVLLIPQIWNPIPC